MPDLRGFRYESDLARATTIPSSWYTDPAMLAIEQEHIFSASWQLVGRLAQLQNPGDFFTCMVVDLSLIHI